jgi:hypothetical protein
LPADELPHIAHTAETITQYPTAIHAQPDADQGISRVDAVRAPSWALLEPKPAGRRCAGSAGRPPRQNLTRRIPDQPVMTGVFVAVR